MARRYHYEDIARDIKGDMSRGVIIDEKYWREYEPDFDRKSWWEFVDDASIHEAYGLKLVEDCFGESKFKFVKA